jgi:drug/metabolite transporter (DMT)-like permease
MSTAEEAAGTRQSVGRGGAYGLAVLSMVIWGSPPVVARAISGGVPPLAVSFWRWALALIILLPFVWKRLALEWPALRPHWRGLSFVAAMMVTGSTLSVLSVYFTTATNAVLVNASQPAVTAAFAWLIAGTTLSRPQRIGVACAFAGIVVMICRGDLDVLLGMRINIGDVLMLLAVVGWSLYAVLLPRNAYAPSGPLLLFVIALTATVMLLPLYVGEALVVGGFEPRLGVVTALVYLAVFPSLLAVFVWNIALYSLGANTAAIFVNLIPISGAVLARVFLGEQLYPYHLVGAALVFGGIFLAVRRR